jgi:hypothetical protein
MLRRTLGPRKDEEVRDGELRNLYCSRIVIVMIKSRRMMDSDRSTHGEDECLQDFGGKAEVKRSLWEDNIKIGPRKDGGG